VEEEEGGVEGTRRKTMLLAGVKKNNKSIRR
jgi:hypothetical protein